MKRLKNRFAAGVATGILISVATMLFALGFYHYMSRVMDEYYPNGTVNYAESLSAAGKVKDARDEAAQIINSDQSSASFGKTSPAASVRGVTDTAAYSIAARQLFDAKLTQLLDYIDDYFIEDVDKNILYEAMLHTLVDTLDDPYSCYYSPEEYEEIEIDSTGSFCGIGATVSQEISTGRIVIVSPYEGSPAMKAGILAGDEIVAVDGIDVTGSDLDYVVSKMRGVKGTDVYVTVLRDGETLTLKVTRDEVEIRSVSAKMLEDSIGYIAVSSFASVTGSQFDKAVDELLGKGMTSLIIDLRDNGGGLMDTCAYMLDRIIEPGKLLVYIEDRDGIREDTVSFRKETLDIPIVVLSNGNSASASEIFLGALKAYGLATIVGTNSFGKGVVQAVVPLKIDNSALRITSWKYYTPDGICIHGVGIKPDVEVEYHPAAEGELYDSQLGAAVELLKK